MRHRKSGTHLGRSPAHRKAMFRNMVTSLLDRERIETLSPVIVQACVRAGFVSLFLVALCQVNYELWRDYVERVRHLAPGPDGRDGVDAESSDEEDYDDCSDHNATGNATGNGPLAELLVLS